MLPYLIRALPFHLPSVRQQDGRFSDDLDDVNIEMAKRRPASGFAEKQLSAYVRQYWVAAKHGPQYSFLLRVATVAPKKSHPVPSLPGCIGQLREKTQASFRAGGAEAAPQNVSRLGSRKKH